MDSLEAGGAYVEKVSAPRLPDLFVILRSCGYWLEAKSKGGSMTEKQVELHEEWERKGVRIPVVSTPDEAWQALQGGPFRTYRDFPWDVPEAERRRRLALTTASAPGRR